MYQTYCSRALLWGLLIVLTACGTPDTRQVATPAQSGQASAVPSTPLGATATLTNFEEGATVQAGWETSVAGYTMVAATREIEAATARARIEQGISTSRPASTPWPVTPQPTWENGFLEGTCGANTLFHNRSFYPVSCWRGMINGQWYIVGFGWSHNHRTIREAPDPEQYAGGLRVQAMEYTSNGTYAGRGEIFYTAPITEGALSLVQISGAVLLLETQQGSQLSFNVEIREWGDADDAAAVPTWTLTPLPTATPLP